MALSKAPSSPREHATLTEHDAASQGRKGRPPCPRLEAASPGSIIGAADVFPTVPLTHSRQVKAANTPDTPMPPRERDDGAVLTSRAVSPRGALWTHAAPTPPSRENCSLLVCGGRPTATKTQGQKPQVCLLPKASLSC